MSWHSHALDNVYGEGSSVCLLTVKGSPNSCFPLVPPPLTCSVRAVGAEILALQCAVRICSQFFITMHRKSHNRMAGLKLGY